MISLKTCDRWYCTVLAIWGSFIAIEVEALRASHKLTLITLFAVVVGKCSILFKVLFSTYYNPPQKYFWIGIENLQ